MSDGATLKDEEEVKPPTNITFTNILTLDLHAGPRRAIRETRVDVGVFADIRILRVFLLGRSADSVLNKMVEQESRVFHDIVVGNFIDSYHNLTLKTMMGIRWVATFCPPAQYIMKTDSDVIVNMHNLIYELLKPTAEPRRRYYVGRVLICSISGLFTKDTETTRRTSCRISGLNQTNAPEEEDDEEDENGSRELNSSLCSADVCDWSMTQCRSHCLQFPPEQHRCTWARCVSSISSIPHVVERQCNRCPGSTHLSLTSSSIAGIWPAALTVM
ncbi:hypothetical protein F2P81_008449 [Scophthalmus maximus]|uniref:Hexosyltransferase n=1 Tax=Scophthalmus maximus TaxID=52904 RepID=A0A6A4TAN5_SCOMX|nr:hypothetical protein F2P81_008449 [Scophthalmus maximus]